MPARGSAVASPASSTRPRATVVLAARRTDRLEALAAELRDAHPVGCDLADTHAPASLVGTVLRDHGRIDVLVNNAGVDHIEPAFERQTARSNTNSP